jgi:GH25 family lysozyme M1 (1,4-beta-N-acetylmuramidase)
VTIFYPDIASFQSGISLAGALAVCAKVTQGTNYANPFYAAFRAEAAAHGALFVAYHFLMAGNAAAQAVYCHQQNGATPLMLDFEPTNGSNPTLADAAAFIDEYRKLGGVVWLVYLPRWYWGGTLKSASLKPLSDRGMLLVSSAYVAYTDANSGLGWQPYGGMTPTVWQYTDKLSFNGRSVDFNAYRGTHAGDQSPAAVIDTLREFRSMVTTGRMPKPPAPKPAGPPFRHVADGKHSLAQLAASRGTTADALLARTLASLTAADKAEIEKLVLPAGFPWYTANP